MPADDRDQKFERALAQHLRRGSAQTGCPDVETLAAYQERSLSPEDMAQWKQHIAGCAACQETLALVEATEKQLAEHGNEQPVPAIEVAAMRSLLSPKAAAASGPALIEKKRRPTLLRWAVPVGAIAAGVLVSIGIYEQRNPQMSKLGGTQVALNREPAPEQKVAQPEVAPAAPPAERDDRKQLDAETARKKLEATINESQDAKRASPYAMTDGLTKDSKAASGVGSGKGAAAESPAVPYRTAPSAATQNMPALREETPPRASESVEIGAPRPAPSPPGPAAPTPAKPAAGAAGNAVGGVLGDRSTDADGNKAAKAKSRVQMQQQAAADSVTSQMMSQGINGGNATSLTALASQPGLMLTPDHNVWWKLAAAGTVELTTDAGKTWKKVDTGAAREFTAGSAPSSKVSWIAGKAGTLVLTTDRGKHWKKIITPITGDLGGVHAVDAKQASIWDAANLMSYETRDGGATWTRAPNQ